MNICMTCSCRAARLVCNAGMQTSPDCQISRASSRLAAANTMAATPSPQEKDSNPVTPKSARSNAANLPVVRLFSTRTPVTSRLRRTSSPMRTTVTLDIQDSTIERHGPTETSSRDKEPDGDGLFFAIRGPGRTVGSPLHHTPGSIQPKKSVQSYSSLNAFGGVTASLLKRNLDKENFQDEGNIAPVSQQSSAASKVTKKPFANVYV